jgi:DNA-binding CsgD family transcriptional regulator
MAACSLTGWSESQDTVPPASDDAQARTARLLATLQQLLAIDAGGALGATLDQATGLIGQALKADMVNAFLYEPLTDCLVARRTLTSSMAQQRRGNLDPIPFAGGGLTVGVFRSGESYLTGNLDQEPAERRDIGRTLEILSVMLCRIQAAGVARGVLHADSAQRDCFDEVDLRFLEAAGRWMGLVTWNAQRGEELATATLEERRSRSAQERRRLTRRELEVAILVTGGLTNDDIADRLVLVRGTVANHIVHMLRKLRFTRRVQIATWCVQHELWTPDAERAILDSTPRSELPSPE